MTKKEIIQLPAGEELNILIAENLFGWKPITDEAELNRINKHALHPAPGKWWITPSGDKRNYAQNYSTDFNEAFKVIDALQEAEYWMRIISGRDGHWVKSSTVEVGKLPDLQGNPSRQLASLSGLPMPEMICKMALVAVLGLSIERS